MKKIAGPPLDPVLEAEVPPSRHNGANATADRAVEMLLCFSPAKPAWTLNELAEHLGMPRSTAYRYANTLRSSGILAEAGGRLSIGPRIAELARIAQTHSLTAQTAAPHLRALHAAFGETVSLSQRRRHEIATLCLVECSHPLRMTFAEQNDMLPWPATANGKLLLAYAGPDESKALLGTMSPVRYTNRTVRSRRALQAELVRIREEGYAVSDEERYEGLRGIAAPVTDLSGETLALSLGAPTFRMSDANLRKAIKAVVQTAEAITRDLRAGTSPDRRG
jgi:DNA-binding IclR family transcriptional regulator